MFLRREGPPADVPAGMPLFVLDVLFNLHYSRKVVSSSGPHLINYPFVIAGWPPSMGVYS